MNTFETLLNMQCFSEINEERQLAADLLQKDYNFEINCVEMSKSVSFGHNGKGCTISAAKISDNVVILQNVTIGANQTYNNESHQWENLGNPVIGENVVIADGAKIVGPVVIGDNTIIGTGAIITKDVPSNSIAYGVNKFKARDPKYTPVFYKDMPARADIIAACQQVIDRYMASK
ncbi:serine acetyltransferase [Weissella oryzae SG25]|uniref:Serine acetyltransferase n=1 Tax=Weissella oryzae (strain DSM 25784 / JCM 18191 / LMG 30913 / SG25) TaxID=1329250 RepID=A0A069CVF3_WEIOS|nr:serine acetyltransferase [Weissella oryzae]GAK31203.1 serine acetyltransferase [Weissella oryzae SG25]